MKQKRDQWQISNRLQTIAAFISDHKRVADIGGDHAFLLLHLAKNGKLSKGIVGEINFGPFKNARDRVALMGYDSMIDVRLGNGLTVLQTDEVDVVVIAGMGGALIAHILEEGKEKLSHVERLILQPNIGGSRVRTWLNENHFCIIAETIVEDADILYEIIVAEPGEGKELYDHPKLTEEQLLKIGPVLWRYKHPLLRKKLEEELASKQKIKNQLELGKTAEAEQRKQKLIKEILEWEQVIEWLSREQN